MKISYKFWNIFFWISILITVYLFLYSFLEDTQTHTFRYLAFALMGLASSYLIKWQLNKMKDESNDNQNS